MDTARPRIRLQHRHILRLDLGQKLLLHRIGRAAGRPVRPIPPTSTPDAAQIASIGAQSNSTSPVVGSRVSFNASNANPSGIANLVSFRSISLVLKKAPRGAPG